MGLSLSLHNNNQCDLSTSNNIVDQWPNFLDLIHGADYGFYHLNKRQELLEQCEQVYQKFSHIKHFVQIGIGGSSLGPEMLVSALGNGQRQFTFINNIDPDQIQRQLANIEISETLFYFVSKSGGTAETMASFAIISNLLKEKGVAPQDFPKYFVFATDPVKSDLLNLGKEMGVTCLEVPSNVGGRFSVLSPVGLLSALFAGINGSALLNGAEKVKPLIEESHLASNQFLALTQFILAQKNHGLSQTVLMPYSSQLKDFSAWFIQLWAESLGKKLNRNDQVVFEGLTPLASYGATDQHSQVQLFMEGPKDKLIILIEVEKFQNDFSLKNDFKAPALEKLANFTLSQLMTAELRGTEKALKEQERPVALIKLPELNEENLGSLILLCESLTALIGYGLNIDPFNQPGVEAGKKYAYEWLDSI